mmetsp:Transcript_4027/g.8152  ORF Transcript_4027/g.8152 Transcript_4027/m.8152 type:complete len:102 (-) Transcript_4027:233-538(-)
MAVGPPATELLHKMQAESAACSIGWKSLQRLKLDLRLMSMRVVKSSSVISSVVRLGKFVPTLLTKTSRRSPNVFVAASKRTALPCSVATSAATPATSIPLD